MNKDKGQIILRSMMQTEFEHDEENHDEEDHDDVKHDEEQH